MHNRPSPTLLTLTKQVVQTVTCKLTGKNFQEIYTFIKNIFQELAVTKTISG